MYTHCILCYITLYNISYNTVYYIIYTVYYVMYTVYYMIYAVSILYNICCKYTI